MSVSSFDTGKILDIEILTKYCQFCKNVKDQTHDCKSNYSGSSGGMEVAGAIKLFHRSVESRGVRYVQYLGDGDSKAYMGVVNSKPYGECEISKLECVGHVQKRFGSPLKISK